MDGAPDILICPLSLTLMSNAVLTADTHTYERASIEGYIHYCKEKGKSLLSPMTQEPLPSFFVAAQHMVGEPKQQYFIANQAVRSQAREWVEKRKKEWRVARAARERGREERVVWVS